jgi:ABC-type phosphate/phosphonate transport system ATPase subunit
MAAQTTCCQVIDGDGTFKEQEVDAFVHLHGVIQARTNYQVVAIMGPQSSGKSTLMNHVVSRLLVVGAVGASSVHVQ